MSKKNEAAESLAEGGFTDNEMRTDYARSHVWPGWARISHDRTPDVHTLEDVLDLRARVIEAGDRRSAELMRAASTALAGAADKIGAAHRRREHQAGRGRPRHPSRRDRRRGGAVMSEDQNEDRVMRLYGQSGGNSDDAIRCAHCGGSCTHPTRAEWLVPASNIDVKDTVWSQFAGYLGCEFCPGITGVHLMFHKGSTWLHTTRMTSR